MLSASALSRLMTSLPAFLALLLLANPAGAQTSPEKKAGHAAPDDSLAKINLRSFQVYGPTMEDVRQASHEIQTAVDQFMIYLGENPKKVAFLLFRTAADAERFDAKPFAMRGRDIVPWILPESRQPAPAGDDANPYTLGHHAGHEFLIAYVLHALAEAGKADTSGTHVDAAATGIVPPVRHHPDTPELPDWLDEAVATLCEVPSLQRKRIDFMRDHLEQRIPFAELLTMRRPESGGKAGGGAKSGAVKSAKGSAAGARREAIFSAEALSLARFIEHREDKRFVGTIVEGVLEGRTVGEVLNTSQSILSKPEALEKQWLEWMQGAERTP